MPSDLEQEKEALLELREDIRDAVGQWAEDIETEEEFIQNLAPALTQILAATISVSKDRGFTSVGVGTEVMMFLNYHSCMLAHDGMRMDKDAYLRLCKVSYEAYENLGAPHWGVH
jgi:hypothetical protein